MEATRSGGVAALAELSPLAALVISRWAGHRKMLCPVVFLEREARAAPRGLWADKAPVTPWEWRASEKGRKG